MPLPTSVRFDGKLQKSGPFAFFAGTDANGEPAATLMLWDHPPVGGFDNARVLKAAQHFASTPDQTPISVLGFIEQDDVDGEGSLHPVLHVEREL